MNRVRVGFAGILLGMSASVLMQTLIATALPTVVKELGGMHLYSWVFGGYMLASTVTVPLFGKLADLMGRRTLYLGGLLLFLAGSVLAGLASSMPQFVAMRVIQGIGAGAVAPAAMAAVGDLMGESGRGRAFGIIGAVQVVANLTGPVLGGWLADHQGWRWGFFLMLPLGLVTFLCAAFGLPRRPWPGLAVLGRVDWLGAGLIGGALAAGLLGLQALGGGALVPGAAGVALAGVLLLVALPLEARHPDPALPLPLLRRPELKHAALGAVLLGAIMYSAIAYIPLYVQSAGSTSATGAGAALLPMLLMAGVGSGAAGWMGRRRLQLATYIAWVLPLAALAGLALLQPRAGSPLLLGATALIGLGMGFLFPLFLGAAQSAGGEEHRAAASGAVQLGRNLGGSLSVPLLGIWLAGGAPGALPAIFACLAAVAGLGLLSSRVSVSIRGGDPDVGRAV